MNSDFPLENYSLDLPSRMDESLSDGSTYHSFVPIQSDFFENVNIWSQTPPELFVDPVDRSNDSLSLNSIDIDSLSPQETEQLIAGLENWQTLNTQDTFTNILEVPQLIENNAINLDNIYIKSEPIVNEILPFRADILENARSRSKSECSDLLDSSFTSINPEAFDIEKFIDDDNKPPKAIPKKAVERPVQRNFVRAGRKKIDMSACKYIVDSDGEQSKSASDDEVDVDIETVSEEETETAIIEADDINSLLEKFEANEHNGVKIEQDIFTAEPTIKTEPDIKFSWSNECKIEVKTESLIKTEPVSDTIFNTTHIKKEKTEVVKKVDKVSIKTTNKPVKKEKKTESLPKQEKQCIAKTTPIAQMTRVQSKQPTTSPKGTMNNNSNNKITKSLPQDLIDKINQSKKRKTITVIQPIAPKRLKISKCSEPEHTVIEAKPNTISLDHNYCSNSVSSIPLTKKDSGFVSSEEDDKAAIESIVKKSEVPVMVSILKQSATQKIDLTENKRKKLNLEEYKKRRKDVLKPKNSTEHSHNAKSSNSASSEDAHEKMIKHQEKLKKMAKELLNTTPKCEKKDASPLTSSNSNSPPSTSVSPVYRSKKSSPKLPPNLERKIIISIGVNTDFKINQAIDPLAPVIKLQEIQPLLLKASDKINDNSLISSVIETIPKVLNKNGKIQQKQCASTKGEMEYHGEDKQVVYLEKDRIRCSTREIGIQTDITLIEQSISKRKSTNRSPSGASSLRHSSTENISKRSREGSYSSTASGSYSPGSSPRGLNYYLSSSVRSGSRSPGYWSRQRFSRSAERDHRNAVEERRIIYIGCITRRTTETELYRKFRRFGPISRITLHYRDNKPHLENFGFVTFEFKEDAHEAFEHGNDDSDFPYYKISFGGRREFCQIDYADLDNMRDDYSYQYQSRPANVSYEKLLQDTLAKLNKRKA